MGKNFESNLRIAEEVQAIAVEAGATPAQVALDWLLVKGADIVPIPGTRRVGRLDNLPPASGGHHNEGQMELIER